MDIPALVGDIVKFLAPFLPYLVKVGEKAAEKMGEHLGEQVPELAREIWNRLRGRSAVEQAARDVAAMPADADAQASLRLQLKKLLAEDAALAQELARLWESAPAETRTVIASGDRAVAIGGNATGNIIVTGNSNRIG